MTSNDRADGIVLLQTAQIHLLQQADAMDAQRTIPGQPLTLASNAATICRHWAGRAADIIALLRKDK